VLLPRAGSILEADERLSPRVERALLEHVVALVPGGWFVGDPAEAYIEYLERRLQPPRAFVQEAERVRPTP
jgi:hypothetical protein